MRNIKDQAELIQLGIYCNIICQILYVHNSLSVCKMTTFAYLIKQDRFLGGKIYTAKNSQDVVFKGLSLLAGDFDGFCNSLGYIIKALDLLINQGVITCEKNILTLSDKNIKLDVVYEENSFMKKVVEESKTMTDRQFLKEVTYNV